MIQKEKTKAVDVVKQMIIDGHISQGVAEKYFPELKESEDEEIRIAILNYLKKMWGNCKDHICGIHIEDAIAWLEKQGESTLIEEIKRRKEVLLSEKEKAVSISEKLSLGGRIAMLEELLVFVNEKQGEQKPTDSYCRENCKGFQETGKCFADGDCKAKREAESIDKVEPKFHEGDFIKHNKANIICKVISVNSGSYYVENIGTNGRIELSNAEQNFHLWAIKDARDGDVLITVDNERPFIFKGCLDPNHPDSPVAYCGIDTEGYFCVGESKFNYWWTDEKVHPATKEQRNLLFQKMKEAGYEWNPENKVLNKIVQKVGFGLGIKAQKGQ